MEKKVEDNKKNDPVSFNRWRESSINMFHNHLAAISFFDINHHIWVKFFCPNCE